MDELDRNLLLVLKDDGRASFRDLAQHFQVSSQTISDRVNKLIDRGIIRGFTVMVDESKVGYPINFVVELDVELSRMKIIQEELSAYPELYQVQVVTGDHDIHVLGVAKDMSHLYEIIEEKISNIEGIKATKTSISLKTVKETPKCII
ncbi:MAG: Lrp/AsnC family transcriptional regulator [Theionarchaea archaeon]|nr:Lrp/AsnC family transcriptional regulator [Theionarchaea archaeon]